MALWPGGEQRQSLSSLYEKIYKDDESENLDDSIVAGAPDQAPPSDQTIDLMIDQTKE